MLRLERLQRREICLGLCRVLLIDRHGAAARGVDAAGARYRVVRVVTGLCGGKLLICEREQIGASGVRAAASAGVCRATVARARSASAAGAAGACAATAGNSTARVAALPTVTAAPAGSRATRAGAGAARTAAIRAAGALPTVRVAASPGMRGAVRAGVSSAARRVTAARARFSARCHGARSTDVREQAVRRATTGSKAREEQTNQSRGPEQARAKHGIRH